MYEVSIGQKKVEIELKTVWTAKEESRKFARWKLKF